jgi:hypothetical protein
VRQVVAIIGFLSRGRTIVGPGFNRWLIPPAALMVHLSLGEIYAFSVFKNPLVERFGVLVVGFIANLLIRSVNPRFHMQSGPEDEHEEESTVSGRTVSSEG